MVQWDAAWALGKIGTSAVKPLIAALKDKNSAIKSEVILALEMIGDERAKEFIDSLLEGIDLKKIATDYVSIINKGGKTWLLILALMRHGDLSMATAFLNCGNSKLEEAGLVWAKEHGYMIMSSFGGGGSGPQWGSKK